MKVGNWAVLIAAVQLAIREPQLYDQTKWGVRTACGTTRCIAGWIAYFGGWMDDSPVKNNEVYTVSCPTYSHVAIEHAALISLELDPEIYGSIAPIGYDEWATSDAVLSGDADYLASQLFSGTRTIGNILETVRDLAYADGMTLPDVITNEMEKEGIPA